jgi:hypothetical protein
MPTKKAASKPKKAAKKTRTEEEYQELHDATVALAKCVILTLNSRGRVGVGSGMTIDLKTKKIERWETAFFDALEMVGICYNRDSYYEHKSKKRKR